jgi:hypothetical protein
MLDNLKAQAADSPARERIRLSLYVAACLLLGGAVVAGRSCSDAGRAQRDLGGDTAEDPGPPPAPFHLDVPALAAAATADEPFRWSAEALRLAQAAAQKAALPDDGGPVDVSVLTAEPIDTLRGRVVQVRGEIVALTQEAWTRDGRALRPGERPERVLLVAVLQGAGGARCVVVQPALPDDVPQGRARYDQAFGLPRHLQVGDHARVRGIVVQVRQGTFDDVALATPAPVLLGLHYRPAFEDSARPSLIEDPREADWEDVVDRTLVETRRWDEDALLQVVQWARKLGPEAVAAAIREGRMPWTEWNKDVFERWQGEVAWTEAERPFTEGARGRLWRLDALVADVLYQGWSQIPPNRYEVDELVLWDVLADDYYNVAVRVYLPFPTDAFPPVRGRRKEHVRIYGLFLKNWTYELKLPDHERNRPRQISVPTFIALWAEPHPEGTDSDMPAVMRWVAGMMVLLAGLFYFTVVRRGRRVERELDVHRQALRQRRRQRASGEAAGPARGGDDDAPEDGEDPGGGPGK